MGLGEEACLTPERVDESNRILQEAAAQVAALEQKRAVLEGSRIPDRYVRKYIMSQGTVDSSPHYGGVEEGKRRVEEMIGSIESLTQRLRQTQSNEMNFSEMMAVWKPSPASNTHIASPMSPTGSQPSVPSEQASGLLAQIDKLARVETKQGGWTGGRKGVLQATQATQANEPKRVVEVDRSATKPSQWGGLLGKVKRVKSGSTSPKASPTGADRRGAGEKG